MLRKDERKQKKNRRACAADASRAVDARRASAQLVFAGRRRRTTHAWSLVHALAERPAVTSTPRPRYNAVLYAGRTYTQYIIYVYIQHARLAAARLAQQLLYYILPRARPQNIVIILYYIIIFDVYTCILIYTERSRSLAHMCVCVSAVFIHIKRYKTVFICVMIKTVFGGGATTI